MKTLTTTPRTSIGVAMLGSISVLASTAGSGQSLKETLTPSSVFAQIGLGDQQTQAYLAGASWDWAWQRSVGPSRVSGYFEGGFGRWTTHDNGKRSAAWPTQISLTPVVRFHPHGSLSPWFVELGVGANYIVPVFDSGRKRFSTEFNFGDHIAIGRRFGLQDRHELSLRVEHFSNAGIEHPNPGENFIQVRYAYRIRN